MKFLYIAIILLSSLSGWAQSGLMYMCQSDVLLLGKNETLVLIYDDEVTSAEDTVNLIIGQTLLSAQFNSTGNTSGKIKFASKDSSFVGKMKVNQDNTIHLSGSLNLQGTKESVTTLFMCDVFGD